MDQVWDQLRDNAPGIIGALAILIIGYLVALVISRLVGAAVRRSGVDHRIARLASGPGTTSPVDGAQVARKVVFWLIMLFVLVAFLQNTGLTIITEPVNAFLTTVLAFIPRLIGALVIAAIAWLVATIVSTLVQRALGLTGLDERWRAFWRRSSPACWQGWASTACPSGSARAGCRRVDRALRASPASWCSCTSAKGSVLGVAHRLSADASC